MFNEKKSPEKSDYIFIISIVENAGLMGMRLPKPVFKAIDILNDKEKENE